MKKIVGLTGAGISAESGVKTFRDHGGLWEEYDVMEVASLEGWHKNPQLVLQFYNDRRRQLTAVQPNTGHSAFAELQSKYDVHIVTQNVDDLHEKAGSEKVCHLHGELRKSRSFNSPELIYDQEGDIQWGDTAGDGAQLRPHIVWFGEMVPKLEEGAQIVSQADIVIIVGTSLQVYPAAGLIEFARSGIPVFYVDPDPSTNFELERISNLRVIPEKASIGLSMILRELI